MRGRDRDPAVELQIADREIDHLGPDEAQLEHIGSRVGRPFGDRLRHRRARDPHVVPDRDFPRLELLDEGTPDRVGAVLVELCGVDPAHVVRLEGLRIEHHQDANGAA